MLRKATRKFTTTLSSPGIIDAVADTFTLANTTNLPTDTQVDLTIDRVDSSGTLTPAKEEVITGTVSGSNIISAIRGVEGTAQAHSAGAVVEVRLTASQWNDAIDEMIRLRSNNYQIVPTVSGNNLTVALKTLAGNNPSALDPVSVRIGNTLHSITSALSTTITAGFNFYNAGSAELATKLVPFFVYLGYNATNGIQLGIARIPYANVMSELSTVFYSEKYGGGNFENYLSATDTVVNIGYFEATLSAGAGYTWSVPTFTATNLINRPIFETRWMNYVPTVGGSDSMTATLQSNIRCSYKIKGNDCDVFLDTGITVGGSASYGVYASHPMTAQSFYWSGAGYAQNSSGYTLHWDTGGVNGRYLFWRKYDGGNHGIGTYGYKGRISYEI